jgi:hypothetical protein
VSEREAQALARTVLRRLQEGWGDLYEELDALRRQAPASLRWRARRALKEWRAGNVSVAAVWLQQVIGRSESKP